jgi:CheY-like chemotaxis protein
LILLAIIMPEISGYEVIKELKSNDASAFPGDLGPAIASKCFTSPPSCPTSAKEVVYCHHEKWDGTGYPTDASDQHIPVCARIMALADIYDALRSSRADKTKTPTGTTSASQVNDSRGSSERFSCPSGRLKLEDSTKPSLQPWLEMEIVTVSSPPPRVSPSLSLNSQWPWKRAGLCGRPSIAVGSAWFRLGSSEQAKHACFIGKFPAGIPRPGKNERQKTDRSLRFVRGSKSRNFEHRRGRVAHGGFSGFFLSQRAP